MNDLNTLLERAAGPATAVVDAGADLTRAHHALARTRRRRGAAGLAGVAALGVVSVGVGRVVDGRGDVAADPTDHGSTPSAASEPTAPPAPVTAGAYTFPAVPDGWEVQGGNAMVVTIAPIGFADQEPLSFPGKLVIGYDRNAPSGAEMQRLGRTFFVNTRGDTANIAARTRADEPKGEVTIQYPTSAGWTTEEMITFLAGVQVGQDAQPGLG